MKDREISEEEKTQARDIFAKTRIYEAEYQQKLNAGELSPEFVNKANLQVKLQQAQFLATALLRQQRPRPTKVTDEEVAQVYRRSIPSSTRCEKRKTAQGILDRAKAGEDFAALQTNSRKTRATKAPTATLAGRHLQRCAERPNGRSVRSRPLWHSSQARSPLSLLRRILAFTSSSLSENSARAQIKTRRRMAPKRAIRRHLRRSPHPDLDRHQRPGKSDRPRDAGQGLCPK